MMEYIGKVGMEECSLDLIFFKLETDHLVFWLGTGAIFFKQLKLEFLDKVKAFLQP